MFVSELEGQGIGRVVYRVPSMNGQDSGNKSLLWSRRDLRRETWYEIKDIIIRHTTINALTAKHDSILV